MQKPKVVFEMYSGFGYISTTKKEEKNNTYPRLELIEFLALILLNLRDI